MLQQPSVISFEPSLPRSLPRWQLQRQPVWNVLQCSALGGPHDALGAVEDKVTTKHRRVMIDLCSVLDGVEHIRQYGLTFVDGTIVRENGRQRYGVTRRRDVNLMKRPILDKERGRDTSETETTTTTTSVVV